MAPRNCAAGAGPRERKGDPERAAPTTIRGSRGGRAAWLTGTTVSKQSLVQIEIVAFEESRRLPRRVSSSVLFLLFFFFYSAVFFFILLGFWQNPCPSVLLSSWYMSDRDSLTRLGSYSATIYLFIRCFSSISRHFPQFNGDIERSQAKSTIELEIDYFFRIVWRIWCNKLLNRILWNYNWLTIAITNRLVTK